LNISYFHDDKNNSLTTRVQEKHADKIS
jgi:hypothetical protein